MQMQSPWITQNDISIIAFAWEGRGHCAQAHECRGSADFAQNLTTSICKAIASGCATMTVQCWLECLERIYNACRELISAHPTEWKCPVVPFVCAQYRGERLVQLKIHKGSYNIKRLRKASNMLFLFYFYRTVCQTVSYCYVNTSRPPLITSNLSGTWNLLSLINYS